jgi:hypothetical protein
MSYSRDQYLSLTYAYSPRILRSVNLHTLHITSKAEVSFHNRDRTVFALPYKSLPLQRNPSTSTRHRKLRLRVCWVLGDITHQDIA